ncbi:MAG: glycosyltransferase family 39 protein [Planctomycetaceae bacterium]|nr:glycosyltransferase family 39 protein [Planctomycetaceae bacterium]
MSQVSMHTAACAPPDFEERATVHSRITSTLGVVAVFVGVVGYQFATGVYRANIYESDGAGHFVTGVMIADYVRTALGANPVSFAEQFYLRSPQVTFSRSPPLFHFLEGAWFLCFGASKTSGMLLIATISTAAIVVLFRRLSRLYGFELAVMGALLFAATKPIRWHSRIIMSDVLTLLLCMLSAFAAADYARTRSTRHFVLTAFWLALAVLTKENALHLLIVLPLFLAASLRTSLLRDGKILAGFALALLLTGAAFWVQLTFGSTIHGSRSVVELLRRMLELEDVPEVFHAFLAAAHPVTLLLAAAGAMCGLLQPQPDDVARHIRLALIWIVGIVFFFVVVPAPPSSRYFMPALVPLLLLNVQALRSLAAWFPVDSPRYRFVLPGMTCIAAVLLAAGTIPGNTFGYEQIATAVPIRPNLVTMIAADEYGEGAFVVERLMADRQQEGVVLRATKVLAKSDWSDTFYSLVKEDTDAVVKFLDEVPVHYIVVDRYTRSGRETVPHRALLLKALEERPEQFVRVDQFPLYRRGVDLGKAIAVYRNLAADEYELPHVELSLNGSSKRIITLKPRPQDELQ